MREAPLRIESGWIIFAILSRDWTLAPALSCVGCVILDNKECDFAYPVFRIATACPAEGCCAYLYSEVFIAPYALSASKRKLGLPTIAQIVQGLRDVKIYLFIYFVWDLILSNLEISASDNRQQTLKVTEIRFFDCRRLFETSAPEVIWMMFQITIFGGGGQCRCYDALITLCTCCSYHSTSEKGKRVLKNKR